MNLPDAPPAAPSLADLPPVRLTGADRPASVLVVCEHASSDIPAALGDLGLAPADRHSHAVWDPGAAELAAELAARLDAPMLTAGISRLVIDLNRPPEAPDAMPAQVERISVPGNAALSDAARAARRDAVHVAFHDALAAQLDAMTAPALITVHSFTPLWHGTPRDTRIGLLHDADPTLAHAMQARATDPATRLNAPYSADDGVTYTLARHATARGLPAVMIEVRNDLLGDPPAIAAMADELMALLTPALEAVR